MLSNGGLSFVRLSLWRGHLPSEESFSPGYVVAELFLLDSCRFRLNMVPRWVDLIRAGSRAGVQLGGRAFPGMHVALGSI